MAEGDAADADLWAALNAYGYAGDDISRADPTKFDAKDVAKALTKLEAMVASGAISEADFEHEKQRFEVRLAEREHRQEKIREREAKKMFALKAKAKAERAARNKADALRVAAEQAEKRRVEYHRRQHAAVVAADALVEPLRRAQALVEQPRRTAALEARSLLRRNIPAAREAGRRDIELASLRALAQAEDRLGNQAVADGVRAEAVSLQRRMPSMYANHNRDGLEVRDGVPIQQLRALDRFLGHGVPEIAQRNLPPGSALALAQNLALPSSPPPRKPTAERRKEQRRLRSIYGEAMSPDPRRRKTKTRVRSPGGTTADGVRSTRSREGLRSSGSLEFGSRSLDVLPRSQGSEVDNGRQPSRKVDSFATHNADAIRVGAAPLTSTRTATEASVLDETVPLALALISDAEHTDGDIIARHAAYGGEFTNSAWLQAQHNAKTREPLCPFDPGPGGLCRNCHQNQRHEWHRPRTPPQAQLANGDSLAAVVTVVAPDGEATFMPELAAAKVLAPRGQEPVDEALVKHEEYRKAKDARKTRIEKLPDHDHGYCAVNSRQAGPEVDLAALLERRWDAEWTLLERSVGSKKEGARQRDLAAGRAKEHGSIQATWIAATHVAKEEKMAAAAEQLRLEKLAEEEQAAKQAAAAAKLKREVEAEQARQACEAEKAEQEAGWRAMTNGFTSLLDEYGFGGGGGVVRAGNVVKLREGLQERHMQENRTAARVQA